MSSLSIKDCPNKWVYIAIDDGGYISTYDVEEDIDEGPSTKNDQADDRPSLGMDDVMDYWSIIVQQVLSARMEKEDKKQCHNLFQTFLSLRIDVLGSSLMAGSCNSLVISKLVKKLGLTTQQYLDPYQSPNTYKKKLTVSDV